MSETEIIEENTGERTRVGFPDVPPEKPRSNKGLILVIALLLLLLGVGGWYMFGREGNLSLTAEATPTPTEVVVSNTPTPTEAVESEVVRDGVTIQVLNGTGIGGAAGDLQKALEGLGYEDIKVGNASPQNATATTVVFDSQVDDAVRKDILKLLDSMYSDVTDSEKTSASFDAVITTGIPKGGRPPTLTPTRGVVSTTRTPTPTRTGTTGTVTVTPTKTPTPTP